MQHQTTCQVPQCSHPATQCVTTPREAPAAAAHYDVCDHHRGQAVTTVDAAIRWDLDPVVHRIAATPGERREAEYDAWQRNA